LRQDKNIFVDTIVLGRIVNKKERIDENYKNKIKDQVHNTGAFSRKYTYITVHKENLNENKNHFLN